MMNKTNEKHVHFETEPNRTLCVCVCVCVCVFSLPDPHRVSSLLAASLWTIHPKGKGDRGGG
jgi:hypothetical protein